MTNRVKSFFSWWALLSIAYGVATGCAAMLAGMAGAFSFGMSGEMPSLFHSKFLFPTQLIVPLPHPSFDPHHVFAHGLLSGIIYTFFIVILFGLILKDSE